MIYKNEQFDIIFMVLFGIINVLWIIAVLIFVAHLIGRIF
jgi:hypothetical protein